MSQDTWDFDQIKRTLKDNARRIVEENYARVPLTKYPSWLVVLRVSSQGHLLNFYTWPGSTSEQHLHIETGSVVLGFHLSSDKTLEATQQEVAASIDTWEPGQANEDWLDIDG